MTKESFNENELSALVNPLPQTSVDQNPSQKYFSNLLSCFPRCDRVQLTVVFLMALSAAAITLTLLVKFGVFASNRDCADQSSCAGQPSAQTP